jgi:CRP-like cAMP-binding protein
MAEATYESNALLAVLEPALRARFLPHFHRVELRRGDVIHSYGQPVERVLFPLTGLVAILTETYEGDNVQTGMVGCDGAIGILETSGSGCFRSRGMVQIPGEALWIGAARCRELLHASPALQVVAEQHLEFALTEARQLMACNALHSIEARLTRSILDALERSCLPRVLPVTQETLAQMLGAQRSSVAAAIAKLQREGAIRSGRGALEVIDVARLEQIACSCRRALAHAREDICAPDLAQLASSA